MLCAVVKQAVVSASLRAPFQSFLSRHLHMNSVRIGEQRGLPIDLCYNLHGDGPNKVLFIMGFMTPHQAWNQQVSFFKDKKEFQICVFDNRGCGKTTRATQGYSTSQMAKDALELCDHLKWNKFHLVGISMGGMISLELVTQALHRIQSLTLAVTHTSSYTCMIPFLGIQKGFWALFNIFNPDKQRRVIQTALYSSDFLSKIEGEGENSKPLLETIIEEWKEMHPSSLNVLVALAHMKVVLTHHISAKKLEALKTAKIPILIMTGTNDDLVSPTNSHSLHKFLGISKIEVFEGAGHCINRECADKFNACLLDNIQLGIEREYSQK